MQGMYKADLCRAAYIYLHGGYYFDVDLLTVRPYVVPDDVDFATVKGTGLLRGEGFFQAFMAASKGNSIVYRSLEIMRDALYGDRERGKYLGPSALSEAYLEASNSTDYKSKPFPSIKGARLLTEAQLPPQDQRGRCRRRVGPADGAVSLENRADLCTLPKQAKPPGFESCVGVQTSACNFVVFDSEMTVYFYSRVLGTRWCGQALDECNSATEDKENEDKVDADIFEQSRSGWSKSSEVFGPSGGNATVRRSAPPPADIWLLGGSFSNQTSIPKLVNKIYFQKDGRYQDDPSDALKGAHRSWREMNPGEFIAFQKLV